MLLNQSLITILGDALDTLAGMEAINQENNQALADCVDYTFHAAEQENDADKASAAFQLYLTILTSRDHYRRCPDCGAIKEDCFFTFPEHEQYQVCLDCYAEIYEPEEVEREYCEKHHLRYQ